MSHPDLRGLFDQVFAPAANAAVLPLTILAVGLLVFLLFDLSSRLRAFRGVVFLATIGGSFLAQLRILGMDEAPGSVLFGTYVADAETALWGCIFLFAALFAWAFGAGYYTKDKPFEPEHDALLLVAPAGMMLMVGAADLLVFFIGLELLSIPLYALAAFRRSRIESVEAGMKYFLLGSFSSAMFAFGAGLLFTSTGTLALDQLLAADLGAPLALAGVSLVAASLFFKVSVFPFHLWVPDVYQGSPTPVTVLMATGTKAAAFGFLVHATGLLPAEGATLVGWIALITMAAGNLGALVQDDLKRMLAYSGVAHAGTVLLVVAGGMAGADGDAALRAALYYMAAYLFTAGGAFGVLSLLESDGDEYTKLDALRGLGRSRPGMAAALSLFMLSLGGIPATGGFLGKWFVFSVLVRADMILIAVLGALLSVVALGYYLRVIVVMTMQPPRDDLPAPQTSRPLTAGLASVVCCAFVLALGLLPGWFLAPLG